MDMLEQQAVIADLKSKLAAKDDTCKDLHKEYQDIAGKLVASEEKMRLHAGDCCSLTNEVNMFKERAEDAEKELADIQAREVSLVEALLDYGQHKWDCNITLAEGGDDESSVCCCGFTAALAQEPASPWMKLTPETMPKVGQQVWLMDRKFNEVNPKYNAGWLAECGTGKGWNLITLGSTVVLQSYTHWMPIPTLPENGGSDE